MNQEICSQVFKARTLRIQRIRIRPIQRKCWRHPFRTSQLLKQGMEVFRRWVARKRRGKGRWRRGGAGEIVLVIPSSNAYGKRWWRCWRWRWWRIIITPHKWRVNLSTSSSPPLYLRVLKKINEESVRCTFPGVFVWDAGRKFRQT